MCHASSHLEWPDGFHAMFDCSRSSMMPNECVLPSSIGINLTVMCLSTATYLEWPDESTVQFIFGVLGDPHRAEPQGVDAEHLDDMGRRKERDEVRGVEPSVADRKKGKGAGAMEACLRQLMPTFSNTSRDSDRSLTGTSMSCTTTITQTHT